MILPLTLADLLFGRPGWVIAYTSRLPLPERFWTLARVTRDPHHRR
jgi:hypothetical protein